MTTPQTIELMAGDVGQSIHREAAAAASSAIQPGHLIELTAAGTVQEHSTAADNAPRLFALQDLPVAGGIDDIYVVGSDVRYGIFKPGQEVYAWVAASAIAITLLTPLESAGDGTLRVQTTDTATDDTQRDALVAYPLEAVDNSGGGSAVRIKVRVA